VAVDDFGTRYSCLGYLQRLPIDTLKIDGSFIREIGVTSTATAIIAGITALAHSLNMRVVAECIETEQQLTAVRASGCDEAQGYFPGRPAAADAWENPFQRR
jgi:EAL domain-containing protein (putative c-di-GMP-specific phosphodiesterase class I)